jgi:hypothetical protein
MPEELFRFERELEPGELALVLAGALDVPTESAGAKADLATVDKKMRQLVKDPKTNKTDYDVQLIEPLHKALKHLPSSVRVDMRMWQWMAVKRFPELVWRRWNGKVPTDMPAALARAGLAARFLGNRSLRGRHRNAISRLFFAADMLYDKADGYKLAGSAFQMQDRHTSLFEREMGLLPSTAKALIRLTKRMNSKDIQRMAKRLNHIGSTLVFEVVEERELMDLLK